MVTLCYNEPVYADAFGFAGAQDAKYKEGLILLL